MFITRKQKYEATMEYLSCYGRGCALLDEVVIHVKKYQNVLNDILKQI